MQEAIVTCTRAAAFGTSSIIDIKWAAIEFLPMHPQFNGMALGKLTFACCSVHSNGGGAGSDQL